MENTLYHTMAQNGSHQENNMQEMCVDGEEAVDP